MSLMRQLFLYSVVATWLSATTDVTRADESSLTSPNLDAVGRAGHAQLVNADVGDLSPANVAQCHNGFFVVSTSQCAQQPRQGCVCQFVIEEYCSCGRFHRIGLEAMLAALEPGVPVCIGVHGSFIKEREVRSLTLQRYRRIRSGGRTRPFHFIAFHWPSDIGIPFCPAVQTNKIGKRAGFNGIYLAHLIRMIPATNPISLVGHSHGTRVISSTLHMLAGGNVDGYSVPDTCPTRRMRAVFGASAIDSHWLSPGEKYGLALNRVECFLNLRTRMDIALTAYPLQDPFLHHALGKTGFTSRQLTRIGGNSRKLREFDVTRYVGLHHDVAAYFPHDVIWLTMAPYLYFD